MSVLHVEAIYEGTKSFLLGTIAGSISSNINFNLPKSMKGASKGTLGLFGAKMTLESGIETTYNIQEERATRPVRNVLSEYESQMQQFPVIIIMLTD